MDADILVGSIAILAGTFISWSVRNVGPFFILMGVFAVLSFWHHMVLYGVNNSSEG